MDVSILFLAAWDLVLKDLVLNGNITHAKPGRFTRKINLVLNGECSPFKTRSFFLVKPLGFDWVMLPFKTRFFKNCDNSQILKSEI